MFRNGPFIKVWETVPEGLAKVSVSHLSFVIQDSLPRWDSSACKCHGKALDHSPRIIGHPDSRDLAEVHSGNRDLLRFCRWEQMVAGMNKWFITQFRWLIFSTRHDTDNGESICPQHSRREDV
jgi:hypothetical protein